MSYRVKRKTVVTKTAYHIFGIIIHYIRVSGFVSAPKTIKYTKEVACKPNPWQSSNKADQHVA